MRRDEFERRRGFTLIELLVVISIIALLVALVLPALGGARRSVQRLICAANLRSAGQSILNYAADNDWHVPFVESPMSNLGFLSIAKTDAELDPFDRDLWPGSLPNVLMPDYIDSGPQMFACPSALIGWPREGAVFRYTYRPASANQPNGTISGGLDYDPGTGYNYFRENFAFLDGRRLKQNLRIEVDVRSNPILFSQQYARLRSTYLRDLIRNEAGRLVGPHDEGMNVLTRNLGVEHRDQATTEADLGGGGGGASF